MTVLKVNIVIWC